jgi:translocator protein
MMACHRARHEPSSGRCSAAKDLECGGLGFVTSAHDAPNLPRGNVSLPPCLRNSQTLGQNLLPRWSGPLPQPGCCHSGGLRFSRGRESWRVRNSTDSPARFGALLGFLAVTFAAAAVGSVATFRSVETWYPTLAKPAWTPPSAVFGPVWTLLYIAMAVAAWRVWRSQTGAAASAVLRHYGAQLFLNALWSVLFFGMRRPDLALLDIAALWMLLVLAQVRFWRADRIAGLLWAPYLLWVSYAAALNAAIWLMNP